MATSILVPHTRIDNSIIDDCAAQIGIYGLGIYVAIKRHLNQKTGDCYPSYQTIARKLGIDRSRPSATIRAKFQIETWKVQ